MTIDIRAALEQLVELNDIFGGLDWKPWPAAIAAARLALAAEPEPPANCPGCEGVPAPGNQPCAVCGKQASPPSPVDGEVAELVTWLWSMHELAGEHNPEEQCRYERAADLLERLAPQPVLVSERSPEVADCDALGRCWCYGEGGDMVGWTRQEPSEFYYYSATHWLPFAALPLPTVGQAPNA